MLLVALIAAGLYLTFLLVNTSIFFFMILRLRYPRMEFARTIIISATTSLVLTGAIVYFYVIRSMFRLQEAQLVESAVQHEMLFNGKVLAILGTVQIIMGTVALIWGMIRCYAAFKHRRPGRRKWFAAAFLITHAIMVISFAALALGLY